MKRTTLACLAALAALTGGPALAQDAAGGWRFSTTLYVWFPAVDSTLDTSLGTLDSSISASTPSPTSSSPSWEPSRRSAIAGA